MNELPVLKVRRKEKEKKGSRKQQYQCSYDKSFSITNNVIKWMVNRLQDTLFSPLFFYYMSLKKREKESN